MIHPNSILVFKKKQLSDWVVFYMDGLTKFKNQLLHHQGWS